MNIYVVEMTIKQKEGSGLKETKTHHLYHYVVLAPGENAEEARRYAEKAQAALVGFASDFDDSDFYAVAGAANCIISNR
jgi:hypothetical protein